MYDWIKLSVEDLDLPNLRHTSLACYLCLASVQDDEGVAALSYKQLTRRTGFSRRAVIDAVHALGKAELIRKCTPSSESRVLTVQILRGSWVGNQERKAELNNVA